jgi:hypothetical protein
MPPETDADAGDRGQHTLRCGFVQDRAQEPREFPERIARIGKARTILEACRFDGYRPDGDAESGPMASAWDVDPQIGKGSRLDSHRTVRKGPLFAAEPRQIMVRVERP